MSFITSKIYHMAIEIIESKPVMTSEITRLSSTYFNRWRGGGKKNIIYLNSNTELRFERIERIGWGMVVVLNALPDATKNVKNKQIFSSV